jgi:putative ABC transport system permease protein
MKIRESFNTAIASIRINKLRSALTMLGIIIGVASVITLTSLGNGFSNLIDDEISASGSDLIYVTNDTPTGYPSLTLEDANNLVDNANASSVKEVSLLSTFTGDVESDQARTLTQISGVSDNHLAMNDLEEMASGTLFADDGQQVAVLGATIAEYLYPAGDALGRILTISGQEFEVVGVLATEETEEEKHIFTPPGGERDRPMNFVPSEDDMIYVPLTTATSVLPLPTTETDNIALSTIVVRAEDETVVELATEQITAVLREEHALAEGIDDDFSILSQAALADTFSSITAALTLFLGAIAGISLLVGGIGIMNIMLVSVTERTREIGIRKSMGALQRDILFQFVIEALVLSLVGGLIGLFMGWGFSLVGGKAIGLTTTLSATMVTVAIVFSTGVGIVFGIYPAWQASKLEPIIALRYE